jgi:hypothetical protein
MPRNQPLYIGNFIVQQRKLFLANLRAAFTKHHIKLTDEDMKRIRKQFNEKNLLGEQFDIFQKSIGTDIATLPFKKPGMSEEQETHYKKMNKAFLKELREIFNNNYSGWLRNNFSRSDSKHRDIVADLFEKVNEPFSDFTATPTANQSNEVKPNYHISAADGFDLELGDPAILKGCATSSSCLPNLVGDHYHSLSDGSSSHHSDHTNCNTSCDCAGECGIGSCLSCFGAALYATWEKLNTCCHTAASTAKTVAAHTVTPAVLHLFTELAKTHLAAAADSTEDCQHSLLSNSCHSTHEFDSGLFNGISATLAATGGTMMLNHLVKALERCASPIQSGWSLKNLQTFVSGVAIPTLTATALDIAKFGGDHTAATALFALPIAVPAITATLVKRFYRDWYEAVGTHEPEHWAISPELRARYENGEEGLTLRNVAKHLVTLQKKHKQALRKNNSGWMGFFYRATTICNRRPCKPANEKAILKKRNKLLLGKLQPSDLSEDSTTSQAESITASTTFN